MSFEGFPVAALDFYDDLEVDNTKGFWEASKHIYNTSVKAPMVALCTALEKEFGAAKVFRPYREDWFSSHTTLRDLTSLPDPRVDYARTSLSSLPHPK